MDDTNYAKRVKIRLIELEKTETWLMEEIRKKTGLYCDTSVMSGIFRRTNPRKKIETAINEILNLEDNTQ